MGFSSYCQVCGLPLSHTCLVPQQQQPNGDNGQQQQSMYEIYRSHNDNNRPPPFLVARLHNWLQDVVAVPLEMGDKEEKDKERKKVFEHVRVEDGDVMMASNDDEVVVADIEDGKGDEYAGLHWICWRMAGKPDTLEPVQHIRESSVYQSLEQQFHNQYFDFGSVINNPKESWRLVDPTLGDTSDEDAGQEEHNNAGNDNNSNDVSHSRRNKKHIANLLATSKEEGKANDKSSASSQAKQQPRPLIELPLGLNNQTLYQILGIDAAADTNDVQIKSAYNRKRKRCHPNAPGGGNADEYERVRQAYCVLSTPEWRTAYDACDFDNPDARLQFANRTWYYAARNTT